MTHGGGSSGRRSRRRSRRSARRSRRSARRTTRRSTRTSRRSTRRAARTTRRAVRRTRRVSRRSARADRRTGRRAARADRRGGGGAAAVQTVKPTQTLKPQQQGFFGKKLGKIGENIGKFKEKIKSQPTLLGKVGAFVSGGGEREPGTIIKGTLPIGGAGAQAGKGLLGKAGQKALSPKQIAKKLRESKAIDVAKRALKKLKQPPQTQSELLKTGNTILKQQGGAASWLSRNKYIIGLGTTVAGGNWAATWLASDNGIGGASITFKEVTDGIAFNENITRETVNDAHKRAKDQMKLYTAFVKVSSIVNPLLWPSATVFNQNANDAIINLDELHRTRLGEIDSREANQAAEAAEEEEFEERREEDIQREGDIAESVEEGRRLTKERDEERETQAAADNAFFAALRKLNQGANLTDEEKQILIERGYDPRGGGAGGGSQLGFGLL